mmetsp:Transcript_2485/g.7641  ORF Transcript_2485/g.7641 Transcript_2485/m.7641 type:complete len:222 (-) Transcript_2485:1021-1686(-)
MVYPSRGPTNRPRNRTRFPGRGRLRATILEAAQTYLSRYRLPKSAKLSSRLRKFDTRTLRLINRLESIRTLPMTNARPATPLANCLQYPRLNIVSSSRSKVSASHRWRFRRASNQFPTLFVTKCATDTSIHPLRLESPTDFSRRSKTRAIGPPSRSQTLSGTISSTRAKETWKKTAITPPFAPITTIAIRGRPSSGLEIPVGSRIQSRFFLARTTRARFRG